MVKGADGVLSGSGREHSRSLGSHMGVSENGGGGYLFGGYGGFYSIWSIKGVPPILGNIHMGT